MILPVYALGQPVLNKVASPITAEYEGLKELIENMWETMYHAKGVGLAAPQIGLPIRLFVIDTLQIKEDEKVNDGFKKVFINAQMINEDGDPFVYEEGCLSIPDIRGDVERPSNIIIKYMDENFREFEEQFTGINARVIQHEYDHTDGILFIEKLKPLKKKLISRKLDNIRLGKINTNYKMKFAKYK